jgi:hypothetical protein
MGRGMRVRTTLRSGMRLRLARTKAELTEEPFARSKFLNKLPIIDMLSIGSVDRPQYQAAQEETFGEHETVRSFYRATNSTTRLMFTVTPILPCL